MRRVVPVLLLVVLAVVAVLLLRLCEAEAEAKRLRGLVEGMREDLRNLERLRKLDRLEGEVDALRRIVGGPDASHETDR